MDPPEHYRASVSPPYSFAGTSRAVPSIRTALS
jgi:hypothetical protein